MKKPCLDCGTLADGTRCVPCRRTRERARPTPAERGYDATWRRVSAEVRAGHPWCSRCGAARDLTVDHVEPHGYAKGLRVLCRSCHSAVGARTDKAAKG